MTDGEKMLWSAIFGSEYTARLREFRVAVSSGDSYEVQKSKHRNYSANHAAETATLGLLATRELKTEDIGGDAQACILAISECS